MLSIIVILYAVINKVNIELDKKMFSLFVCGISRKSCARIQKKGYIKNCK